MTDIAERLREAENSLPDGDIKIDVELVNSGWIAYVCLFPVHGPIVPVERDSIYARTGPKPTRGEALDALSEAFAIITARAARDAVEDE